jgi:ribA/ribD-fused uncharacterized protein
MERITDTHIYFWGSELSNWFMWSFKYKGHEFKNSEQAFMWEKAMHFGDILKANEILKEPNPRRTKQLGREVKNFNTEEWLRASFDIMVDVNYAKWTSNKRLQNLLMSTGNKTIVEASPQDALWGIGLHWEDDAVLDERKWKGTNWLGEALMKVREKIRNNNG